MLVVVFIIALVCIDWVYAVCAQVCICGDQKSTPGSVCLHLSHPIFVVYLSF